MKILHTLFLILFSFSLLCGCRPSISQTETSKAYDITDDTGRTIHMVAPPKRIVSVSYGIDEILVALVDLSRISGFSSYAGDEGITFTTKEQVAQVGHTVEPQAETIIAAHPDLVFVTIGTGREVIDTLTEMGIPVYVSLYPKNWSQLEKKIKGIAKAVKEEEKGDQLLTVMNEKRKEVEYHLRNLPNGKRRSVIALSFSGPVGKKNTILADIMSIARIHNCIAEGPISGGNASFSKEYVVETNPDVIFLPTWNFDGNNDAETYKQEIANDPAYANIQAIKNDRLVFVSDKYRYVSSHHTADSLEIMAKTVYPECWDEES